jgi:DNA adenine methylase
MTGSSRRADPALHNTTTQPASGKRIPPLIKWPGGKRFLLEHILPEIPGSIDTYYEPFLGGAAVFLQLRPKRAVLSDSNAELINLYECVRDHPSELIDALLSMKNSRATYYEVRASRPRNKVQRAARLFYLTRLSFNGIYRVNLKGEFNVPYGCKRHLSVCQPEHITTINQQLQNAALLVADFEEATKGATKGAVIYFDPPYTVAHSSNGFIKYNEKIFSWDDQVRLARHAETLVNRGCHVVISNADHGSIRKLYKNFRVRQIERHSKIAATAAHRKKITELIITPR